MCLLFVHIHSETAPVIKMAERGRGRGANYSSMTAPTPVAKPVGEFGRLSFLCNHLNYALTEITLLRP